MLKKIQAGFTLVELLVIIVVLGVLTGLVIITYGGVKEKAYNTRVIAGVRQYSDAIKVYKALYRAYPKTQAEIDGQNVALTCLGGSYPNNTCGKVTNTQIYVDAAFYSELNKVLKGTKASINDQSYSVSSEDFIGAVYGIDIVDPEFAGSDGRARTIQYALIGSNVDCVIQGARAYNRSTSPPTTACEIVLEPYNP